MKREGLASGLVRKAGQGVGILFARLREQGLSVVGWWIRDHFLRRVRGVSPANSSRIAPNLYVGGQHYRHGLDRMAALGISATVNLRGEADDRARGVALERHLWLPTVDEAPPTLRQLSQAAEFARQAIDAGRGVYIHCAAGVGRAPTAAAAYLVSTGMEPAEAWALIRQGRPFIRPKAGQFEQIARFRQQRSEP
jgi:dual specificity MAP kinase phosphatase